MMIERKPTPEINESNHPLTKIIFGGGEMGRRIRSFNWSNSSLGPISSWPKSLTFAINMMLQSPASMALLWGREGITLYNDAYIAFAGKKHPEMLGSRYEESWPVAADLIRNIISKSFEGESLTFTNINYTVDRGNKPEEIWKDLQCSPVLDEKGEPAGVLIVSIETTQYVQAEEALRKSEERYRSVVEGTNEGIWDYFVDTRYSFWNDRMFEIIGYEKEDIAKPGLEFILSVIHPEDKEILLSALERTVKEGALFDIEYRVKHYKGHYLHLHAKGKPVYDANGNITRIAGITIDISERKKAEEALKENEDRLSGIFNQTSVGIAETDLAGKFVLANEQFCQIVGRSKKDLYQLAIPDLTHPDDLAANFWLFERVIKEGTPFTIEKRFIRPDGSEIWVKNNISLVRDAEGKPIYILAVCQDITERKLAELEKGRLLSQTQALNLELEVSQGKLLDQNENLKKINAELDSFVYRTSHDLRAPLASVLGLINVCRLDTDESNQKVYLELMEKSISKLDNFINDIINFSRNTRVDVSKQEIDLSSLIQESLEGLRYMEGYESIDKRIDIKQEAPFYSDLFRLKIICNNLISNAVKYQSPIEENPFVLVKVQARQEGALFEFSDNGRGIPHDKVDKIFDMFYRASESSKGSGLGLYIVKEVVHTLNGKISVHSQPEGGTSFVVEIPNSTTQDN